jgi:hypothetical protein
MKDNHMKKLISTFAMLLLFAVGCTDQTNITSPDDSSTNTQKQLVKLPAPQGLSVETIYTESKNINGYTGGYFTEQFSYQSAAGTVTITSKLVFPPNSFSGTKTITQAFNTETASLEFGPSMNFNRAVKYTLTISGIDLSNINTNTLDFAYIAPDGSITGVVYDSINIDAATNSVIVTNARLNHFSRYGFINVIIRGDQ